MVSLIDLKYAQRLRGLRLAKDLPQKKAADLLGLESQQTYSKLENGQIIFTDDLIKRICNGFKIQPGEFTNTDLAITVSNDSAFTSKPGGPLVNEVSLLNIALTSKQETIDTLKLTLSAYEKQLAEKDAHLVAEQQLAKVLTHRIESLEKLLGASKVIY